MSNHLKKFLDGCTKITLVLVIFFSTFHKVITDLLSSFYAVSIQIWLLTFLNLLQLSLKLHIIVVRSSAISYDPMVRNPLFSRADKSIAAELTLLSMHYHPSVAVFASNLLNVSEKYKICFQNSL